MKIRRQVNHSLTHLLTHLFTHSDNISCLLDKIVKIFALKSNRINLMACIWFCSWHWLSQKRKQNVCHLSKPKGFLFRSMCLCAHTCVHMLMCGCACAFMCVCVCDHVIEPEFLIDLLFNEQIFIKYLLRRYYDVMLCTTSMRLQASFFILFSERNYNYFIVPSVTIIHESIVTL